MILSVEGGLNYGFTDYKTSNFGYVFRGAFEYYPYSIDEIRIGLKVFGGGLKLNLEDSRGTISSNDGPRTIPAKLGTDMLQLGGLAVLGINISDVVIPYLGIGGAYTNLSPKDENGNLAEFNNQGKYDKSFLAPVFEGGISVKISDRVSATANASFTIPPTDYLDDVSAASSDDSYFAALIGISYAFKGEMDSDGDAITSSFDKCPDEPEDFDGFQDDDGCPDLDNDGDGIPDLVDKCPNEAEDFDGFQDNDGCPDLDNDADGIADNLDKCPDQAEDKDGYQDDDGCPDLDNDGDGIVDSLDQCPDEPETVNGYLDDDGCPDSDAAKENLFNQFILRGDDTFNKNTSVIKDEAKILLNEISDYIKSQPGSKWRIEGHMDNQGSAAFIKKLSTDRAKSVYDYFVSRGLSPEQFSLYGFSDSSPIASNDTEEGRSNNRRIIITRE